MNIQRCTLARGTRLALSRSDGDSLFVVVGSGRCTLDIATGMAGIWVSLHGTVHLAESQDANALVRAREVRITQPNSCTQAAALGNGLWIALLGSRASWDRAFWSARDAAAQDILLLPAIHSISRDLQRSAVTMARHSSTGILGFTERAFVDSVRALQAPYAEMIARCPGRTFLQRRQVFLRLQRVRNFVAANCHLEMENNTMARMANYAPCHFLRTFRQAYGQTPHAFLMEQRLQQAWRSLRTSQLAISEVASASGFGNRCAFARLFRKRFGATASEVRDRARGNAMSAQSRNSLNFSNAINTYKSTHNAHFFQTNR